MMLSSGGTAESADNYPCALPYNTGNDNDNENTRLVSFRDVNNSNNNNNNNDNTNTNNDNNENSTTNRYYNLLLVALTPIGVKFFKSSQSSFQEYLMNDPQIEMTATTYGIMLTLISMPLIPLFGGMVLDWSNSNKSSSNNNSNSNNRSIHNNNNRNSSIVGSSRNITLGPGAHEEAHTNRHCLVNRRDFGTKISQSYSFVGFLVVAFVGIVVYGYGLSILHSIKMGLVGASIFGVGEGCIMVAARAFVAHEFLNSDGAFAQGCLIAMNNLSMLVSKNLIPYLIEHENNKNSLHVIQDNDGIDIGDDNDNIYVGIVACCIVQGISLVAGILYATRFETNIISGCCNKKRKNRYAQFDRPEDSDLFSPDDNGINQSGFKEQQQFYDAVESNSSEEVILNGNKDKVQKQSTTSLTSSTDLEIGCTQSTYTRMSTLLTLPITFWIVAIGRAVFVVTFKVFSRYSNSFLIEKFGVNPVKAGQISSINEVFALFSPLVGYLAYRSPGGIVGFALGAGVVSMVSIGTLTFCDTQFILEKVYGGILTPLVGISIAHGIIIPISMAMIPHTVYDPSKQLGMAFAIFEVLGSTLNLTDIVFGYLRDQTGNYDAPMKLLFVYASVGTLLMYVSRKRIGAIGIGDPTTR